jgi:hypothetical protein
VQLERLEDEEVDLPSFMLEIEHAQRPPLEQLAVDFFQNRSGLQSLDFCKRCAGLPASTSDEAIAHRLGVAISTVRGWREVGKRMQ